MSVGRTAVPLYVDLLLTLFIRAVDEPLAIGRELRVAFVDRRLASRMYLALPSCARERMDRPDAVGAQLGEQHRLAVRRPGSRDLDTIRRETIGHATVKRHRHEARRRFA